MATSRSPAPVHSAPKPISNQVNKFVDQYFADIESKIVWLVVNRLNLKFLSKLHTHTHTHTIIAIFVDWWVECQILEQGRIVYQLYLPTGQPLLHPEIKQLTLFIRQSVIHNGIRKWSGLPVYLWIQLAYTWTESSDLVLNSCARVYARMRVCAHSIW